MLPSCLECPRAPVPPRRLRCRVNNFVVVQVQSARDSIPRGWKPKTGEYYGLGLLRVLCTRSSDQHGVVCTGKNNSKYSTVWQKQ